MCVTMANNQSRPSWGVYEVWSPNSQYKLRYLKHRRMSISSSRRSSRRTCQVQRYNFSVLSSEFWVEPIGGGGLVGVVGAGHVKCRGTLSVLSWTNRSSSSSSRRTCQEQRFNSQIKILSSELNQYTAIQNESFCTSVWVFGFRFGPSAS